MTTYLTPGAGTICPNCKNGNYAYALPSSVVMNTQSGSNVSGTVNHCDNCQHNWQRQDEG